MIESLTPEQEAKLKEYRDKWLDYGLKTEPADRVMAEAAIPTAYTQEGLKEPLFKIWFDSPWQGAIAASVISEVAESVSGKSSLFKVSKKKLPQVIEEVKAALAKRVSEINKMDRDDPIFDNVRSQVQRCGYGLHDASWIAYYDYMGSVLGFDCCDRLKPLMEITKSCGWWWPFDEAVIMTERPCKLFRDDDGRLHSELGAAIEYPDGWGVYSWHGVRVPKWIITEPEKITPEKVLTEGNQEIRRVMLERYGWDNLLDDLGATTIHEDSFGKLVETDKLGKYLDGEDPKARFVLVVDPSTERRYALRVSPTVETAHGAVASTFGVDAQEYTPIIES